MRHETPWWRYETPWWVTLTVVVLLFASGGAAYLTQHHSDQVQQRRRDAAVRGVCLRSDLGRSYANLNGALTRRNFLVETRIYTQPSVLRVLSPADRAYRLGIGARATDLAMHIVYQPQGDCDLAVRNPLHYRPPPAHPMTGAEMVRCIDGAAVLARHRIPSGC